MWKYIKILLGNRYRVVWDEDTFDHCQRDFKHKRDAEVFYLTLRFKTEIKNPQMYEHLLQDRTDAIVICTCIISVIILQALLGLFEVF